MATVCCRSIIPLAGVYDMKVGKELSGTVTNVKFTNPHGSLAQRGIGENGPNALDTGDKIKVKFLPAPDRRVIRISAGKPNE